MTKVNLRLVKETASRSKRLPTVSDVLKKIANQPLKWMKKVRTTCLIYKVFVIRVSLSPQGNEIHSLNDLCTFASRRPLPTRILVSR